MDDELVERWQRLQDLWQEAVGSLDQMFALVLDYEPIGASVMWCKTHDKCYLAAPDIDPAHGEPICGPKSQFFASAREPWE